MAGQNYGTGREKKMRAMDIQAVLDETSLPNLPK